MVWFIRSRTRSILTTSVAAFRHVSAKKGGFHGLPFSFIINSFLDFPRYSPNSGSGKLAKANDFRFRLPSSQRESPVLRVDASSTSLGLVQEHTSVEAQNVHKTDSGLNFFNELKSRFLNFKKHRYLEEFDHFQTLAKLQSPKFMVIACVDSRVCPSNILGFQPGEAFMVRNVANLVPPLENGPTETNAALQFAVNTLEVCDSFSVLVENIFVIGHSNCAGIQALMSMQEDMKSSFVEKWVAIAKVAKLKTEADASDLSFDLQCKHCEKESINCSLLNLLTYPWIEERVRKGRLSIHGGYYDFVNCTFEKWTLEFMNSSAGQDCRFSAKAIEFWC